MINKFAIVCSWPERQAAENETISRISYAASLINKDVIVITTNGEILNNFKPTKKFITNEDVDFVINLHYSTPKGYDGFSYVALWNPIDFYYSSFNGYFGNIANTLTHHDALSCYADIVDHQFIRNSKKLNKLHEKPYFYLSHSNAGPYYEPDGKNRDKIFYCGINWDKNNTNNGRFGDIFKILGKKEIIEIYGPERYWKGITKAYRGFIPFDGISLIKVMSKNLLGIAFSHKAHIESKMISSRIFELVSAGVLPICDQNEFVIKHFGDLVLYCDTTKNDIIEQIEKHYTWAKQNPDKVNEMVIKLQDLIKDKYNIAKQIEQIYKEHTERRIKIESKYCANTEKFCVNILYIVTKDDDLSSLSCIKQKYKNIKIFIIVSDAEKHNIELKIKEYLNEYNILVYQKNHKSSKDQVGEILQCIKEELPKEEFNLFMLMSQYERIFYDHISSLVRKFEDDNTTLCSYSIPSLFKSIYTIDCNNNIRYGISSVLFKKLPDIDTLLYISYNNFLFVIKNYFDKNTVISTNLTTNLTMKNELYDSDNIINSSLSTEIDSINNSGLFSSQLTQDIIRTVKAYNKIRDRTHKIRDRIRKITKPFSFKKSYK